MFFWILSSTVVSSVAGTCTFEVLSFTAILLVLQNENLICFRMETIMFIVARYRYFVILANSGYMKPCFVLGQCFKSFTTNAPKVPMVLWNVQR